MRGLAAALAVACVAGIGPIGCASKDARLREGAPDLPVGAWQESSLHCDRGRCVEMFRLVVERPATWVVEADSPADPLLPDFYLVLEDDAGHVIGDDREAQKRPRRVTRALDPGLYFVRVAAQQGKGDLLSYKLRAGPRTARARRAPSRAPAPPPPVAPKPAAPVFIESELLEVERDGGEPIAVLIEAGTSQGLAPGQSGELVEGDAVIGRIEIVDVYAAGSRARIVGGLRAPITLGTRARVQK